MIDVKARAGKAEGISGVDVVPRAGKAEEKFCAVGYFVAGWIPHEGLDDASRDSSVSVETLLRRVFRKILLSRLGPLSLKYS